MTYFIGHYSYLHTTVCGDDNASVYDHYIDIDRINAVSGDGDQPTTDPGVGDTAVRSRGYEKLDPSDLSILHQPQEPQEYAGLVAVEASASTQVPPDEVEMTRIDYQNTVCRRSCLPGYCVSTLRIRLVRLW